METTAASSASAASSAMGVRGLRWNNVSASNIIQAPFLALLDYSGLGNSNNNNTSSSSPPPPPPASSAIRETQPLIHHTSPSSVLIIPPPPPAAAPSVSIRIIGAGDEDDQQQHPSPIPLQQQHHLHQAQAQPQPQPQAQADVAVPTPPFPQPHSHNSNTTSTTSHTYAAIQHIARCLEHILPFSLLLLVVFIRKHLQGFFGAIWVSAVLFKSNDILRKQTALKGERRISLLVCITLIFMFHVFSVYWWYQSGDLIYPLVLLPPKTVPPFWHAIFVIIVNDTMVRQAAMVLKCILLMYYKNSGGHNHRKQGQMLTLVEYMLLLYRALLPTPVWYRFFLNKEYGSLFSSLTTGLYLTFKLTSVVQKVQMFFAAFKALSQKEVHYGSYATSEQVNAAGDLCAICQEKMHSPILLSCKHIFCEDCVSEWFERERTCPLCRALVRPADIKSYGDGSTSLFFQIF